MGSKGKAKNWFKTLLKTYLILNSELIFPWEQSVQLNLSVCDTCLYFTQSLFKNRDWINHFISLSLPRDEQNRLLRWPHGPVRHCTHGESGRYHGALVTSGSRAAIWPSQCAFLRFKQRALTRTAEWHWKFPEDTTFHWTGFNQQPPVPPCTPGASSVGQTHQHSRWAPACLRQGASEKSWGCGWDRSLQIHSHSSPKVGFTRHSDDNSNSPIMYQVSNYAQNTLPF